MYIFLLILWSLHLSDPPAFAVWAADILSESARAQSPVRLVWNQSTPPSDVESLMLNRGAVLTTSIAAARLEVLTEENAFGDIHMTVRMIDAQGLLLSSTRHTYRQPGSRWKRTFDRFASPALVTAATGLTIYLLYNVRSR